MVLLSWGEWERGRLTVCVCCRIDELVGDCGEGGEAAVWIRARLGRSISLLSSRGGFVHMSVCRWVIDLFFIAVGMYVLGSFTPTP